LQRIDHVSHIDNMCGVTIRFLLEVAIARRAFCATIGTLPLPSRLSLSRGGK
jgi:hypothetical protein